MARDLSQLLADAQDPATTSEGLKKIWNSTKSFKIRKAVTLHPNCSVDLMRMCARLYMKEVLTNTTFELLSLFGSDDLITTAKEAYESPETVLRVGITRNRYYKLKSSDQQLINKAMLISPNLTWDAFNFCWTNMDYTVVKRELSDKEVKARCRALVQKTINNKRSNKEYDFSTCAKWVSCGLLDDLDSVVKRIRGDFYNNHGYEAVSYTIKKLLNGSDESVMYATKMLISGGDRFKKDLIKKVDINNKKVLLKSLSKAYIYALDYYGAKYNFNHWGGSQCVHDIYNLILDISRLGNLTVQGFYDDLKSTGVMDLLINLRYRESKNSIHEFKMLMEVNSLPKETIKDLIKLGFLNVPIVQCSAMANIITALEEMNQDAWAKSGGSKWYYNCSELSYIKKVTINNDAFRHHIRDQLAQSNMPKDWQNIIVAAFSCKGNRSPRYPNKGNTSFTQVFVD